MLLNRRLTVGIGSVYVLHSVTLIILYLIINENERICTNTHIQAMADALSYSYLNCV